MDIWQRLCMLLINALVKHLVKSTISVNITHLWEEEELYLMSSVFLETNDCWHPCEWVPLLSHEDKRKEKKKSQTCSRPQRQDIAETKKCI